MKKKNGHCNRDPHASGSGPRWSGKPYNFFGDYLWEKYRARILKLPIDAGMTCPNRDGTVGSSGCIFCGADGSASPVAAGTAGIELQMQSAREGFRRSDPQTRYIAYFQAFSNTYAPVERLRAVYDRAILDPDVMGLMIGTRPDCLPDETLDLIAGYKKDGFELWLEIGMQSAHDGSLAFLNRGHTHASTRDAILRAAQRGIPVCVHLILGIPFETWDDIMATAAEVSSLPVSGVKIHHLHVIRGTRLDELYSAGEIRLPGFREYVSTVCDFIERLRPDILIHRLIGDRPLDSLVGPSWAVHKGTVLKAIEDEFLSRGSHQGFLVEGT